MARKILLAYVFATTLVATGFESALAHGLIGKRVLPATLATDDPFVADELSLPTIFHIKKPGTGDTPPTRETDLSWEFSMRLSPDLVFSVIGALKLLDAYPCKAGTGFDNL